MGADDVTTTSSGGMTAGRQGLNDSTKVSLLDGLQRLEAIRPLYVEGDVG